MNSSISLALRFATGDRNLTTGIPLPKEIVPVPVWV